jgi:hypothetical protein
MPCDGVETTRRSTISGPAFCCGASREARACNGATTMERKTQINLWYVAAEAALKHLEAIGD